MGARGELFSVRFTAANKSRTYFFNVKKNRRGDVFLSLVESKPQEGHSYFERFQVVFFEEDIGALEKAIEDVMVFLKEKGIPEMSDGEWESIRKIESSDDASE